MNVIKDRFTKTEDTLIGLQTQVFLKNVNSFDNVHSSERVLVLGILKKEDLWFKQWTTKESRHWLSAFPIKFKTVDNSLSLNANLT